MITGTPIAKAYLLLYNKLMNAEKITRYPRKDRLK